MSKRVAIYCRVSTVEQAEEGYSVDEQRRRCIEYCEKDKIEYQKTIKELLNKYALVENQEQDEFKGEVVKIHISIGKKKKIRIGDIVGALSNIDGLENSDLGVIKIYDNYSTVDILNQKGKKFLNDYKEIIVKNKKAKIREEK